MPNDSPPHIKYTSRVRRGFGYILNKVTRLTAQTQKDADLAVTWMEQEYQEQMRRDSASCPSTPSTPPAESSNPPPSESPNPLPI